MQKPPALGNMGLQLRILERVFERSKDAIAIIDVDGRYLHQNPAHRDLLGYEDKEIVRSTAEVHLGDALARDIRRVVAESGQYAGEVDSTHRNGHKLRLDVSVFAIHGDADDVICVVAVARDMTARSQVEHELNTMVRHRMHAEERLHILTEELEQANRELQALVNHDPITRVLNRQGLKQSLAAEIADLEAQSESDLQAVLVDCDDFSQINDRLGFAVGDIVLREVAQRLREAARETDIVARISGDEFMLMMPHTDLARAERVAERLRLAIASTPIIIMEDVVRVTVSLGVVTVPATTSTIEEILTISYGSLHQSKQDGKNRVSSSDWPAASPGERNPSSGSFRRVGSNPKLDEIGEQLLGTHGIRAVKQVIVDLASEETIGYEFLCRGPQGPFESPLHFFRVSLEQNILTPVDLRCLQTCVQEAKKLDSSRVHLNLFPSTMLATPKSRLLDFFSERPERFVVELSEQQFLGDTALLRPHVLSLRASGVKVAVDDVGFGRSSLEALLHLEPDVVKIDRKCVQGIARDADKARLLARLVRVVRALGAEMVAEGIENRRDLMVLQSMGVDYGQGFLWGRPE